MHDRLVSFDPFSYWLGPKFLFIFLSLAIVSSFLLPTRADTATTQVRHFVALKFKPDVAPKKVEEVERAFFALKEKIPQVMAIEYGSNSSAEELNEGCTNAFLLTFANEKDRDIYLDHKEHQNFKKFVAPFVDKAFVFDFCTRPGKISRTVVDLTHILSSGIPDYEGRSDAFQYKTLVTIAKDGYSAGAFNMPEHCGTHMDAPSHFCAGVPSIDEIPADKLIAPCVVIDARKEVEADADYRLTVGKIKSFETHGEIPPGCIVLFWTGWADRWSTPVLYRNADSQGTMHFPGVSLEAAQYLIDTRHVAGFGIDTLSMDYGPSHDFPVHKLALSKGLFLIENLDNLSKVPSRNATLYMGPLRIKSGTGSPARVMAVVP